MSTFVVLGLAAVLVASTQNNPPPGPAMQARVTAPTVTASASQQAFARGQAAERQGKLADAVQAYRQAAASGDGAAARRLGEIYSRGGPGVDRDMAEALRWNHEARERGEVIAQAVRLR